MGLESGSFVNDLVITNPIGASDPKSQGDNHLRLLKTVLKASLPSLDHAVYLERPRADVADSATPNIGAATTEYVNLLGSTTITSLGTAAAGIRRLARFNAARTLTHNATSLILPGGANITTAAGDMAGFISEGSGNWRCEFYTTAAGVTATALAAALLVTESETIGSNDNDTTVPSSAAVKDFVTGQQTIWVPAAAMTPRTTNGAAPGVIQVNTDVMVNYLAYDPTTTEYAQFFINMPKGWDEGTFIVQFIWTHPATVTNFGVRWGIKAASWGDANNMNSWGTEQEVTDTGGFTHFCFQSPETSALTASNTPDPENMVWFEVYRDPADAADNMAVDAWLLGVRVHYTTNAAKDD